MQITRDITKYTKDYLNSDYDFEKVLVQYRRKKVLEVLEQYKPKNILEIGCGVDTIANYYTTFDAFTIIEPSQEFASKAVKNQNDKIKVYVDFIENQIEELKHKNFDCILLSSLLHEVENPHAFFEQIVELCNQNTILHINVPNSNSFHLLWAYQSGLLDKIGELTESAKSFQRHTAFSLEKLESFVGNYPLHIIDKGSYFIKPFNHKKMQQLLDQNIIDTKLLDGLYYMTQYMPDLGAEIYINCRLK